MKRLHAVLAVAWLLFAAPCILIPAWRTSVPLLVFILHLRERRRALLGVAVRQG